MRPRSVYLTLSALTLAHAGAGLVLVAAAVPDPGATAGAVLGLVIPGAGLVLAWLIAVRAVDNPVPTALAVIAALATVVPFVEEWGASAGTSDPWPAAKLGAPLVQAVWPLQLAGFGLLLLTFPAARLRRPFARRALRFGGAAITLVLIGNWGTTRGDEFTGWRVPVTVSGLVLLAVTLLACTTDLVHRARRAGPAERQQIRWLQLASGCVLVLMLLSWLTVPDIVPAEVVYAAFLTALYLLVPGAVAVAVIRHDLFDIDRLLSESAAVLVTSIACGSDVGRFGRARPCGRSGRGGAGDGGSRLRDSVDAGPHLPLGSPLECCDLRPRADLAARAGPRLRRRCPRGSSAAGGGRGGAVPGAP